MLCLVLALLAASAEAEQTFTGRLSDSTCAASHRSAELTDRQCLFACINHLAKYVLVDQNNQVLPISNQDARGLPLYAGRPVRITGERKDGAIVVSKVEAIPAHLHIGHVMTNWRDTPGTRGFLPVALEEARVAALHAQLAARATRIEDVVLHVRHVLNALDPSMELTGPGAGYGVKKAAAGALQHLDLAAGAEGSTEAINRYAAQASASLTKALELTNVAIPAALAIQGMTDPAAAAAAAADLSALVDRIRDEGIQPAHAHMTAMLKAEGIFGAPR